MVDMLYIPPLNWEGSQLLRGHDRQLPQTLEVLPLVDGVGGGLPLAALGGLGGAGPDDLSIGRLMVGVDGIADGSNQKDLRFVDVNIITVESCSQYSF